VLTFSTSGLFLRHSDIGYSGADFRVGE